MEDLQPTAAYIPEKGTPSPGSTGASRPNVGLIAGQGPRFADETARLLRRRLKAAVLAMVIVLSLSFLLLLPRGAPLLIERFFVLGFLLSTLYVLRGGREFSLRQLRVWELVVFFVITCQLMLMMGMRMSSFIEDKNTAEALSALNGFHAAFIIVLFTYAVFIPNRWQRASMILFPMALAPYAVVLILRLTISGTCLVLCTDETDDTLPLPLVAAGIAAFGAHTISTVRREAFKARQFGQYHLKEKIGSGGMGEVYHAEHRMLKRPCALKLIRPESAGDGEVIQRFEKEVRATAALSHFNTVEIFDYGRTDDGTFYYVMEFLPGMTLEQLVREHGPLPPGRAVRFLAQTCGSLEEAHGAGLIHRDIKPANIFAAKRGGMYDIAKVLDFGLVRETAGVVEVKGDSAESNGGFSGSPLYMAPEQATAYDEVDARCDIYALGAVAYFLVTGEPPFIGFDVVEVLRAHANEEVLPPGKVKSSVPSDLESVIMRCLSKNPADRYPDAAALKKALLACKCAGEWNDAAAKSWWDRYEPERADLPRERPDEARPYPKAPGTTQNTADFDESTEA